MKVLVLTNHQLGLVKFRKELIEELVSKKHKVYISVPDGEYTEEIKELGCRVALNNKIDRRGTNPVRDLELILYYKRLMKKVDPDVVLTYTIKPNIYGGVVSSKLNILCIANVTGLGTAIKNIGILRVVTTILYRIGLQKAQVVFFQNKENCKYMVSRKIVREGQTRLIPGSGVNINLHCYEAYPNDDGGIVITTIGRIMKDKGIDEIIRAAKRIKKKYRQVRFQLVGDFDGCYEDEIVRLNEQGIIKYLGQCKDIHPYIAESHAILHASYHEGMSNVLQEAASTGRPVIATNIPGCREVFEEGVTGIGFEPKNVDSLVEAVEKFLAMPNGQREKMGRKGREKMVREFDRRIVVQKYMDAMAGECHE